MIKIITKNKIKTENQSTSINNNNKREYPTKRKLSIMYDCD